MKYIHFMKLTDKTYYRIAGVLSCITALVACIFGFINNNLGTQVPTGMMWLCFGMAFFVFGLKTPQKPNQAKSKI
jgi:hypothetical protein